MFELTLELSIYEDTSRKYHPEIQRSGYIMYYSLVVSLHAYLMNWESYLENV